MTQEQNVSELFASIVAYADAMGARNINELPGCWEAKVDDKTFLAVNGHQTAMKASRGPVLEPYHAFVEINGWPAALLNPYGGVVMGGSEDDLIERFRKATPEARHD